MIGEPAHVCIVRAAGARIIEMMRPVSLTLPLPLTLAVAIAPGGPGCRQLKKKPPGAAFDLGGARSPSVRGGFHWAS